MPYIYIDKQTNDALLYGSIKSLSDHTGMKTDNLYTCFSRNKKTEFENNDCRILKRSVITAAR